MVKLPKEILGFDALTVVLVLVIISLGTGLAIALAMNDTPNPDPQQAPEVLVSWYVEARTIPPVTPNGSLTVTLLVTSPDAPADYAKPGLLNVTLLYLPWDVTLLDLGDNPAQALNAGMQALGGGEWFQQIQFHGSGETTTVGFPHYAVNSTGQLSEVVSVVAFMPETGGVMGMGFNGQVVKWASVDVDGIPHGHAWAPSDSKVKAAEAKEADAKPQG